MYTLKFVVWNFFLGLLEKKAYKCLSKNRSLKLVSNCCSRICLIRSFRSSCRCFFRLRITSFEISLRRLKKKSLPYCINSLVQTFLFTPEQNKSNRLVILSELLLAVTKIANSENKIIFMLDTLLQLKLNPKF